MKTVIIRKDHCLNAFVWHYTFYKHSFILWKEVFLESADQTVFNQLNILFLFYRISSIYSKHMNKSKWYFGLMPCTRSMP